MFEGKNNTFEWFIFQTFHAQKSWKKQTAMMKLDG